MANFYQKPFIYLPKKKASSSEGGDLGRSFYVQGEPHFIHNNLDGTYGGGLIPTNHYVPQGSCQCYFYKYWNLSTTTHYDAQTQTSKVFKNKYSMKNNTWLRFDYKPGEMPTPDTDKMVYSGVKLKLDNTVGNSSIPTWSQHNYAKLIANYIISLYSSNWHLSDFISYYAKACYVIVGYMDNLYVLCPNPTQRTVAFSMFQDSGTITNPSSGGYYNTAQRQSFDASWESFMQCSIGSSDYFACTGMANMVKAAPGLSGEPECEVFLIGTPYNDFGGIADFTNDELLNFVHMLCNVSDGDFNYTSISDYIINP